MHIAISFFKNSAGILLLAMAAALFLINWTNPSACISPHDPICAMPINEWFYIFGSISAGTALGCFFSERSVLPLFLLTWAGFEYLLCRLLLSLDGCHNLTGYLEGFSRNFGISAGLANTMADLIFAYMMIGGCIAIWLGRQLPPPAEFRKMPCPSCGGHVNFPIENLGQRVECPHCKVSVTLREPEELLKMGCFFCKGHIEFPAHALGRKIKCPHCKIEVGLKETQ